MFDEPVEVLGKFQSVVVERRHVSVARHIFNVGGPKSPKSPKSGEGLEPVVLGDGALSTDHARHLVQQAIHGAPFAVDDLGRVEVLFDHRRSYAQAMLAPDRGEEGNDALLLGNGTPLCVRHSTRVGVVLDGGNRQHGDHVPAIIGLAQDQLDVVFCGHLHERLERKVVIATQRALRRRQQEHPAVQQLKHCIGRFALAAP
jgi:hypothetical protein